MKVRRIKKKLLYQVGVLIILLEIGYMIFTNKNAIAIELGELLSLIFLLGAGFCATARAFYFDRHIRILLNKPIVNFGLFLNTTKLESLIVIYFLIKPLIGKQEELFVEKNRIKINIFAISAYVFIIAFIVLLILTN